MAANKISYSYAAGVYPQFSTVAELRDASLASYPDAEYFKAPVVGVNRDDTAPAWGWLATLLRTRTDWWAVHGGTSLGFPHFRLASIVKGQREF